jgi:ubiquinone/menaquinone biosynthesis C-methylase UbiE
MSQDPAHSETERFIEVIDLAASKGNDDSQRFFDSNGATDRLTVRGYWDFAVHILTPAVSRYMPVPEDKVALEIGCGGGRLLNASCSFFKQAHGVDIHSHQREVEEFLATQSKDNYSLLKTSGSNIDVASGTIDFVYSLSVLQHVALFEVFQSYVNEAYRCLKVGGVAQLYFGRYSRLPVRQRARAFANGYREMDDQPVNHTNLVIRTGKAKEVARSAGFSVVDHGDLTGKAQDGSPDAPGRQSSITLLKM